MSDQDYSEELIEAEQRLKRVADAARKRNFGDAADECLHLITAVINLFRLLRKMK